MVQQGTCPVLDEQYCAACHLLAQLERASVLRCGHRMYRTCIDDHVREGRSWVADHATLHSRTMHESSTASPTSSETRW